MIRSCVRVVTALPTPDNDVAVTDQTPWRSLSPTKPPSAAFPSLERVDVVPVEVGGCQIAPLPLPTITLLLIDRGEPSSSHATTNTVDTLRIQRGHRASARERGC
jgi:hypothetical protein